MKDKAEKRKWGLIVFVVLIMIGTTFSFVFFGFEPQNDVVRYNGMKFIANGNPSQGRLWIVKINGKEAAFSFLPGEVENIISVEGLSSKLQGKFEIDVTSDFNSTFAQPIALAQHQMSLTLGAYDIYLRKGFTTNNTFNFPVITCNDSTSAVPVIYYKHGNSTIIHSENNCIIAEASSNSDFIRVKDRIIYSMLGVIK